MMSNLQFQNDLERLIAIMPPKVVSNLSCEKLDDVIEIVLDIISKPKMRQQTLRVPMQTSNCLFVNKLTTITYMFPSNLINHIAVLQKNTKKENICRNNSKKR